MDVREILQTFVGEEASDVFLMPGLPLSRKVNGKILPMSEERVSPETIESMIRQIYELSHGRDMTQLITNGDDDFSFSIASLARFRVSAFKQRGSLAAVIRIVNFDLPDYRKIHIPEQVMDVVHKNKGLVLVTGLAGSGKSTTLACIIDQINRNRNLHIITLEDPVEYLHRHNKSIVTQREIGPDSQSYITALRAALRQAPDVILLGEMRDHETIKTAITAAETGHLVISTLHTIGASNTIDRIIDSFAPEQQQQIRIQLSMLLVSIFSQQLLPATDGTEVPAFETVYLNDAMRNMIRESKTHQIDALIHSGGTGIQSMDESLLTLYREKLIEKDTMLAYSSNREQLERRLQRAGQ